MEQILYYIGYFIALMIYGSVLYNYYKTGTTITNEAFLSIAIFTLLLSQHSTYYISLQKK